jgi:hypothetical protein
MTETPAQPKRAPGGTCGADGSTIPEVHIYGSPVPCPHCGKMWTADNGPQMRESHCKYVMPTGPHCPHCGGICRVFLHTSNTSDDRHSPLDPVVGRAATEEDQP